MSEDRRPGWYYYEHTNGSIIGKNPIVVDACGGPAVYFDSDFVVRWWKEPYDSSAWTGRD